MAQEALHGSRSLTGRRGHGSRWALWLALLALVVAITVVIAFVIAANDDDDAFGDRSGDVVPITQVVQVDHPATAAA